MHFTTGEMSRRDWRGQVYWSTLLFEHPQMRIELTTNIDMISGMAFQLFPIELFLIFTAIHTAYIFVKYFQIIPIIKYVLHKKGPKWFSIFDPVKWTTLKLISCLTHKQSEKKTISTNATSTHSRNNSISVCCRSARPKWY